MPKEFSHLWLYFLELSQCRTFNGSVPNPIRFQDLESWARLTGRRLSRLEFDIVRAMDAIWLFWKPDEEEE